MTTIRKPAKPRVQIELEPKDLPAHCPADNTGLWCAHPRVYVAIGTNDGDTWLCPYCGTRYVMKNP